MAFDIERLLRLWDDPVPASGKAEQAFRAVYADPVVINGQPVTTRELVEMARRSHASYQDPDRIILDLLDGGDKVAFAFLLRARQNGRPVQTRVIDMLTLTDGLVSAVWTAHQPMPT